MENLVDKILHKAWDKMQHPNIRHGQALITSLHEADPELYVKITGTVADCFYLDSKIPAFWAFIEKENV